MDISTLPTLIPALAPYVSYIAAVVGVAAFVAPYLPPPALPASGFYPVVYGLVNWLARNVGHAANATAPTAAVIPTPNTSSSVS